MPRPDEGEDRLGGRARGDSGGAWVAKLPEFEAAELSEAAAELVEVGRAAAGTTVALGAGGQYDISS